jgi:hypothetical protein
MTLRGTVSINGYNHNFVNGVDPYIVKGRSRQADCYPLSLKVVVRESMEEATKGFRPIAFA